MWSPWPTRRRISCRNYGLEDKLNSTSWPFEVQMTLQVTEAQKATVVVARRR